MYFFIFFIIPRKRRLGTIQYTTEGQKSVLGLSPAYFLFVSHLFVTHRVQPVKQIVHFPAWSGITPGQRKDGGEKNCSVYIIPKKWLK